MQRYARLQKMRKNREDGKEVPPVALYLLCLVAGNKLAVADKDNVMTSVATEHKNQHFIRCHISALLLINKLGNLDA